MTAILPARLTASPTLNVPPEVRLPEKVPAFPNTEPPLMVNAPAPVTAIVPSSVVLPAVCVKLWPGATVKVVPVETFNVPALLKAPAVVKFLPEASVKLPAAAFVAKFARPFVTPVWSTILELAPVSVIFAAFVTMLAPLNCSVPVTL